MERVILHSDLNNFFAAVECLHRPEVRDLPVAVAGNPELRHGIILAKNIHAKKRGVITGEAIWQAKAKCPDLVAVPPDYNLYLRFARLARSIYADYTDRIEPFGIDEAWMDLTGCVKSFDDGIRVANEVRARLRDEVGTTASVGVSFNKVFAKLGSDLKKPDATTVISPDNFRQVVYPLPVQELLYVGHATQVKLNGLGIYTIGQMAKMGQRLLHDLFGKWGDTLWSFATGQDDTPVTRMDVDSVIKSIGNSITTVRDLADEHDVKLILYTLAESVAERLRGHDFKCRTVHVYVRDNGLDTFTRQGKLPAPSNTSRDLGERAVGLFREHYDWNRPVRSLGIRGTDLVTPGQWEQLCLTDVDGRRFREEALEHAIDGIRGRFGHFSVQRAAMLEDRRLSGFNPIEDHTVHPLPFFKGQ